MSRLVCTFVKPGFLASRPISSQLWLYRNLSLCILGNCPCFYLTSVDYFHNYLFQKILSGALSRVSNCLDPDQDQHSVSPYLGPNCLQKLSAAASNKERVELQIDLNHQR